MSITKSFIISYHKDTDRDELNLKKILTYLLKVLDSTCEIVLVEQGETETVTWLNQNNKINYILIKSNKPFNKGWGYNIGVKKAKGSIIILHDITTYLRYKSYKVERLLNTFGVIKPYNREINLNGNDSNKFLSNFNYSILIGQKNIDYNNSLTGIFMIKKSNYLKIGGFDESVSYYMGQVSDFEDKIKKLNLSLRILNDICLNVVNEYVEVIERKVIKSSNLVLSNIEDRKSISIIIPAYESEKFIEECLDSIENQTYFKDNNDYEILVGVDGCKKTLNKLLKIKDKYRNLKILNMLSNKGLNITINTLLSQCNGEYILKFDSDDYLDLNAFEEIMKYNEYDIIRFKSNSFNDKEKSNLKISGPHDGVFLAKRRIYNELGGFKPWKCGADTDFRYRLVRIKYSKKIIDLPLFFRRIHKNSLTNSKETGFNSELRNNYTKLLGEGNTRIIPEVNEFIEIKIKIPISIIITAWQTQNYIEECLDSIENQTYFKDFDDYEILVGVDACQETLDKLLQIRHKYRNLRIFMMKKNRGTYITSNTLIKISKHDFIIRFDSDDVMTPIMIEKIIKNSNDVDIVRFGYHIFCENTKQIINQKFHFPHGVVLYKRRVFEIAGGFRDWKCAADTELIERIRSLISIKEIDEKLFYRRRHENSLTKRVDTKFGSDIRTGYKRMIKDLKNSNPVKIKMITNGYKEYKF